MLAVCAWRHSAELNSFSSKRDIMPQRELDGIDVDGTPRELSLVGFTDQENYGHDLFYAVRRRLGTPLPNSKFSNCMFCHSDNPRLDTGAEPFQLYSRDDYHNIGTPRNPEIPLKFVSSCNPIDPDFGIAGHAFPDDPAYPLGFFKTPILRNVDKRKDEYFIKTYTHNGWFKSLESVVHFYNSADVDGLTAASFGVTRCPDDVTKRKDAQLHNCWPAPAYHPPQCHTLSRRRPETDC